MYLTSTRYIYPPRSNSVVYRDGLDPYREMGHIAQLKYNDTRLKIQYLPEGGFELWTRHRDRVAYQPSTELTDDLNTVRNLLGLAADKFSDIDGGLLHNKHSAIKNTVVIWDILVRSGEHLLGTSYLERYNWIRNTFKAALGGEQRYIWNGFDLGIKITDHVLMPDLYNNTRWDEAWELVTAVNNKVGFVEGKDSPIGPLLEGLVLKLPGGKLQNGFKEDNNSAWQVRCRVHTGRHR